MTTEQTQQPANDTQTPDHKRLKKEVIALNFTNKTKGEALFNAISYFGVGYIGVTATSVLMTWMMRDFKPFAGWFEKTVAENVRKIGINSSILNIGTLFFGGTLASVLPVKALEDHKPFLVRKLDHLLYTEAEYNDPKIQQAHKELDELPKQTWLSVFGSRIVAFAATLGVYMLIGQNKSPVAKLTGQSLDKWSIQFGRRMDRITHGEAHVGAEIDRAIAKNIDKMNTAKYGNDSVLGPEVIRDKVDGDRVASRVWSYIGLDALYTVVTSISLFVSTRILGGLFGQESSEPTPQPATHHTPTPTHHTTTAEHHHTTSAAKHEQPTTEAAEFTHHDRVHAAHTHELTA